MFGKIKSLIKKVVGISTTKDDCKEIDNMPPWGHSDLEALGSYSSRPVWSLEEEKYFDNMVDDWFNTPYNTEVNTAKDVVTGQPSNFDPISGEEYYEPDDIHDIMYEEATKNGLPWTQGGSETFQENVNLDDRTWQSGTGWGQYR